MKNSSEYYLDSREDVDLRDAPRKFSRFEVEKYGKLKSLEDVVLEFEKLEIMINQSEDPVWLERKNKIIKCSDVIEYMKKRIDEIYEDL